MRRRALLSVLTTASVAGIAGCLGGTAPRADSGPANSNAESSTARSRTSTPTYTPANPPAGPVRCRGNPVSVERKATDESGYEDNIEYFPGNETVRVVTLRNSEGPAGFDTWSFEEWGSIECAEVGLDRVRDATADRLGTDEFGSSLGQPPGFFASESLAIWLNVATRITDGETEQTPTLPLARLADVAPRSVDVTVALKGDTFSRTVSVFAEHVTIGPA